MIKPFEEVNKDWTFFDWDEWNSIRHKIGEDKFEEIKDDLYDILEHVYGVGFNEGFIDARHYLYKYSHKVRRTAIDFYKNIMKEHKNSADDIFDFVTKLICLDDEMITKEENEEV